MESKFEIHDDFPFLKKKINIKKLNFTLQINHEQVTVYS